MEIKSNPARISKFFSLPPLNQTQIQEQLQIEDKYHNPTHHMVGNLYIFGVEVEVENCTKHKIISHQYPYWTMTTDNSLRNQGIEFVSLPIRASQVENALTQLFNSIGTEVEFTPRTSTHVHMNVRDLTLDQISCLVILYTALENVLFNWVGHNRDESIFCIKITETDYVNKFLQLNDYPKETIREWNKYTALNLLPIESKGSVEFRHLEGTNNKTRILTWINILSCLKTASKQHGLSNLIRRVTDLNTSSEYEMFVHDIFDNLTDELCRGIPNLQKVMEEPISYIKLALVTLNKNFNYKFVTPPPRRTLNPEINFWDTIPPTPTQEEREPIPNVPLTHRTNTLGQQTVPTFNPNRMNFETYMEMLTQRNARRPELARNGE